MFADHDADKPSPAATPEAPAAYPDDVVLLVGTYPGPLPSAESVRFTLDTDAPCGLVVLLPGADVEGTFELLAQQGRPAIPIADLSGGATPRADARADFPSLEAIEDAIAETQTIRDALRALPPIAERKDVERLSVLRLASSRQTGIEARWDPGSKDLVHYPLLSGLRDGRVVLEQLARAGFLARSFFERLHTCGNCGSSRMPVREVCTSCGSADLREETLIHHYRCASQAPRSQFERGQDLVCPKCNRTLRHYGVDYDAPGTVQHCNQCHEVFSESDVAFKCADCGQVTPADKAATTDWYGYSLTAEGHRAALRGELPSLGLESFVAGVTGHRAPRDFALMIDFADRVQRRYERPFSIVTISFLVSDDSRSIEQLRAESMVWDIIRGTLRESDFIAALEHQLVLLLPETEPAGAKIVVDRINTRLAEATAESPHIRAEILTADKIPALVEIMRGA